MFRFGNGEHDLQAVRLVECGPGEFAERPYLSGFMTVRYRIWVTGTP